MCVSASVYVWICVCAVILSLIGQRQHKVRIHLKGQTGLWVEERTAVCQLSACCQYPSRSKTHTHNKNLKVPSKHKHAINTTPSKDTHSFLRHINKHHRKHTHHKRHTHTPSDHTCLQKHTLFKHKTHEPWQWCRLFSHIAENVTQLVCLFVHIGTVSCFRAYQGLYALIVFLFFSYFIERRFIMRQKKSCLLLLKWPIKHFLVQYNISNFQLISYFSNYFAEKIQKAKSPTFIKKFIFSLIYR